MGWVKVCKNNQEHLVTSEIYESVFKHQGFRIANASQGSTQNPIATPTTPKGVKNELPKSASGANKGTSKAKV